tara:strand:- start:158 stop:796 length:639 start_codon:yes stop_codon:yes gene_type:complete
MNIDSNLYLHLTSLGDVVPLDFMIDIKKLNTELEQFKDDWKKYHPRKVVDFGREALPLTSLDGELAGINLDSLREHNAEHNTNYKEQDFNTKTSVAEKLTALHPLLDLFDTLGRSHLIKLKRGGYFPPHRDGKIIDAGCYRVLTMLDNCKSKDLVFLLGDQRLHMEIGRPYLVNTRKLHTVFSFTDNSVQCVLNMPLTAENYTAITKRLKEK